MIFLQGLWKALSRSCTWVGSQRARWRLQCPTVFGVSIGIWYIINFNETIFRVNWSGTALNTFYAAVRKALLVVLVLRAVGVLVGLVFAGWWVFA